MPMGQIDYSRAKLSARGWLSLAAALASLWLLGRSDGLTMASAAVAAPASVAVALASFAKAYGTGAALLWDAEGLTVSTLFARRRIGWSSIVHIGVKHRRMRLRFGLLPVPGGAFLTIQHGGGAIRPPKVALAVSLLDLQGRPVQQLVERLQGARRQAADAVPERGTQAGATFDPDAIIARYVAQRATAVPPPAQQLPKRASFGRKGANRSA
jgi:hypothetical protein